MQSMLATWARRGVWGRRMLLGCGLALAGMWAATSHAQGGLPVIEAPSEAPAPVPQRLPTTGAVDFTADVLEYVQDGKVLSGRGHAEIRYGGHLMTCDEAQYSQETGEIMAQGNVRFTRSNGATWTGQRLIYNVKTGEGDFGAFAMHSDPYHVYGEDSQMIGRDRIDMKNILMTTCEDGIRECYVRASRGTLREQRYLEMWNASVWLGSMPVLYFPYYRKDLKSAGRWDFVPGYRSALGAYLLTSYTYPIVPHKFRGQSTVHLYSERGEGFEQSFRWIEPTNHTWQGFARGAYIRDPKLYRNPEEQARREATLDDSNRYRLRFEHTESLTSRDYFIGQGAYLSDPYFLEDYFREEYREMPIPENRLAYTHRGDHYSASILVNKRLNDFYPNIDRLPELRLAIDPVQIGDSPFYYQGNNSAGVFQHLEPDGSTRSDYDAMRADTSHTLSYPGKYLGFLSLIPKVGFEGTYYSKTLGPSQSVTNWVTVPPAAGSTNTVPEVKQEITTTTPEEGADFRQLYTLGLESSFKAYKVLDEGDTFWGRGMRHVFEPYSIYTYTPEPNLTRDQLYQFDEIDKLGEEHTLRLGMRNKLQTRVTRPVYFYRPNFARGEFEESASGGTVAPVVQERPMLEVEEVESVPRRLMVQDLVDFDIYSTLRIKKQEGEGDLGPIVTKLELRPSRWLKLDFDAAYDPDQSKISQMNTQLGLIAPDSSSFMLEHLYRPDSRNLLTTEFRLRPKARWSFGAYQRYDIDQSRIEEHSYFVQCRMKCVGWGVGVRDDPATKAGEADDLSFTFQFWLLALPTFGMTGN